VNPLPGQLQQEPSRSVCSGHSGQELKCSEEEPGASAPRLQERTALATAAAPPASSRGASERRSRCSEPSRATLARPLLKFARGPWRAGQPVEERSRHHHHHYHHHHHHHHRHRGLGVPKEGLTEHRVRINPRRCCRGSAVPSSWRRRGREVKRQGQQIWAFLRTRVTPESGAGRRSDSSLWAEDLKGPGSAQLPAGRPEKQPQPQARVGTTQSSGVGPGKPWRVSAERSPGSSGKEGSWREGKGEAVAGRPLTPVHTHPTRQTRSRGAPLGALVPWRPLSHVPAPLG
jgi:hypothetical protein